MELTKIKDVAQYFEKKDNKWIFTGKKLEVYIPRFYQERDLLVIGDVANVLGIFQLRIDDKFSAVMMILARIDIEFVNTRTETEGGFDYIVLELGTGSTFIANSNIVKNSNIIYEMFIAFLAYGKIPPYLDYTSIQSLFDQSKEHCGVSLGLNHAIFEVIYAHAFRSSDDPYQFYRNTPMNKPPVVVALHQISHGPISSSSRIIGSYMGEGIVSSLVDDTERTPSLIENLMRI